MEKLLSHRQVAELVGVSRRTLYDLLAKPGAPAPIRLTKRTVRYKLSDVLEWLDRIGGGAK